MKSNGEHNLSFASFLAAPIIFAITENAHTPIISFIFISIALFIAVKFSPYFTKTFGIVNIKRKYTYIAVLSVLYILIANYMDEYRISFMFIMLLISSYLIWPDLKRMDNEYNKRT